MLCDDGSTRIKETVSVKAEQATRESTADHHDKAAPALPGGRAGGGIRFIAGQQPDQDG
ncbi:hypothetical protein ACFXDH_50775 [Streptomyces sp. NPDC059467]|uniref:hypothetical protein n=1 Tax=Streptomyces sp. NPDC059467 TaxID=3346844 RepID=UPI00367CE260